MAVSQERMEYIFQKYDELKEKFRLVDRKYEVTYVDIVLDLPETLNLEPLVYTEKTQEELEDLALQKALPSYLSKLRQIDNSYNSKVRSNAKARQSATDKYDVKLADALTDYNENCDKLMRKLINNGLMFSSIITDSLAQLRTNYTTSVQDLSGRKTSELTALTNEKTALDNEYDSAVAGLEEEKEANVSRYYNELVVKEEKQRESIEKYNQTLAEKESKYQASREKSQYNAQYREYERAIDAAELYAEIGEVGIARQKSGEKLYLAKYYLIQFTTEEAQLVVNSDAFLQAELGSYYDLLLDYLHIS